MKNTPQPTPAICKAPPTFPPPTFPPATCHITLHYDHEGNGAQARSWDGNFPLLREGTTTKYYRYITPTGLHHVAAFIIWNPETLVAEVQIGIEWPWGGFDVCVSYTIPHQINPYAMKAEETLKGQNDGNFRFYIYS